MSIKKSIEDKLEMAFNPVLLSVENESKNHNVPEGAESHFKVTMISEVLEGQTLIRRHRSVNALLVEQLEAGVHALSLHLYTPEEWSQKLQEHAIASPPCRGGEA